MVVYGRGILRAPSTLDCGFYPFKVHNVFMAKRDGEAVLAGIRERLDRGEVLDEAARIELMLLPLMSVKRPLVDVVEDVTRLAGLLPKAEREEIIGTVIGLAYATIKATEAARLLEVLRMSNVIEDFVVELLLRGRREGREEGREEGQVEGWRVALLDILASRFGPVPPSLARQIDRATNVDQLRSLVRTAATATSFDTFMGQIPQDW